MYSVLLIDDEKSIRENLAKAIPFEEHGFCVSSTAQNGKEALEKLPEVCPDLILLDVRMPVMDGLEFLSLLRQGEYANTQVVMLSGYYEFEYAKEAMKYGVKAYLSKPVDVKEILPLLDKIRRELDNYRNEKDNSANREHMKLFQKLYNGVRIERSIFKGYTYMVCVLLQCKSVNGSETPHDTIQECFSRQLGEIDNYQFRVRGSQYSFLLPPKTFEPYSYDKRAFALKLSEELKNEGLECALLFDSYVFEHSKDTFREDLSNHNYEMLTELFFSRVQFLDYCPDNYKAGGEFFLETKYLEQIKQHILSLDRSGMMQDVERLAGEIYREHTGIQFIQEIIYRIYYLLINEISKVADSDKSEPFLPRPEWMDNTYFVTFSQWQEMLRLLIAEGFDFIEKNTRLSNAGIGKEVIEYILSHYMEQISLKQVADIFYINAAYLGRVFQKTTGMSFKEYVNKIRISEAKKLLMQTDKLIYEIANVVGFTESSYFIVKFSQEVGKSPSEYRNEMQ
ncbi:MAG TPA: response regulator [Clostridia bacterium]|nr:response regulator [Clostridia bacterium]